MADNDLANRRNQNTNIVTLGSFQQEQTCIINSGYDRKRIRFALVMELTSVIISHVLTEQQVSMVIQNLRRIANCRLNNTNYFFTLCCNTADALIAIHSCIIIRVLLPWYRHVCQISRTFQHRN